jgi:hypothetical protein
MMGWMMVKSDQLVINSGEPRIYHSSAHGRRHFCGSCGTGVFYTNAEVLPGLTDIQSATLDDPNAIPPQLHIQTAERIEWMKTLDSLPEFERYSPQG